MEYIKVTAYRSAYTACLTMVVAQNKDNTMISQKRVCVTGSVL